MGRTKSTIPPELRNERETPGDFFAEVQARFGMFDLDVAASAANAKCKAYLTKEDNAFVTSWGAARRVWCNPPYNAIPAWIDLLVRQARTRGVVSVLLVPQWTDRAWFPRLLEAATEVVFVRPRVHFPVPGYPKGQPEWGVMLAVVGPKVGCALTAVSTWERGEEGR